MSRLDAVVVGTVIDLEAATLLSEYAWVNQQQEGQTRWDGRITNGLEKSIFYRTT